MQKHEEMFRFDAIDAQFTRVKRIDGHAAAAA